MSKHRIENFEEHLLSHFDRAIKEADRTFHDSMLHWHWSHWHPISTAPYNRNLELQIVEATRMIALPFPCRHTNGGDWINVDLGTRIQIQPVSWRVWQHSQSPQPHHSSIRGKPYAKW